MTGLSNQEVLAKRKIYGFNEINLTDKWEKLKILLKQFSSPMVYILIAASLISYFTREIIEFGIILLVLILNTALGFFQEARSVSKARELKSLLSNSVAVYREGRIIELDSRELVPGDVIFLQEGNKIPADAVLKSGDIQLNESAVTGESLPVFKKINELLYSGTYVSKGNGQATITKTGLQTFIGNLSKDLTIADTTGNNFIRKTKKLTLYISAVSLLLFALVITLSLVRGEPFTNALIYAISILVSGIPEGLPAVITIALTTASLAIAKNGAIVKKLEASEAVGEITTIITDKTGTLTENKMSIQEVYLHQNGRLESYDENSESKYSELLHLACKYSNTIPENELTGAGFDLSILDPTESALYKYYQKSNKSLSAWKKIYYSSFDSERQYQEIALQNNDKNVSIRVGAPEKIAQYISEKHLDFDSITKKIATQGGRSLAISSNNSGEWNILAIVHIGDNLRSDAKKTILKAQQLGVRVIMATGDHPNTALYFAKASGITGDTAITGADFLALNKTDQLQTAKTHNIFARMIPEAKKVLSLRLQALGENVGMTGHGVNDAPVLKYADIGIAMGQSGTEIAKESADIILTNDNLSVIIDAIKQGRILFQNIYNGITYLISTNLGELTTFAICLIAGLPAPLAATQILWMNLITDGLNGIALTQEKNLGSQKFSRPIPKSQGFIDQDNIKFLISNSLLIGIGASLITWYFQDNIILMQSLNFVFLSLTQIINQYTCRNPEFKTKWRNMLDNKSVNSAFTISGFLTIFLVQGPFNKVFELQGLHRLHYIAIGMASIIIFMINRNLKRQ